MIEFVSWVGVAIIALFAVVGFTGVVATSALTVVRGLRHRPVPVQAAGTTEAVDAPRYISSAA
jgi:hypothetical protein